MPVYGPRRGSVNFGGAFHAEGFGRPFAVKFLNESVKLSLLLQDVGTGGPRRLLLQSQVPPFVAAVLLRMSGLDALDRDSEPQPPDRELRKLKQSMRRSLSADFIKIARVS